MATKQVGFPVVVRVWLQEPKNIILIFPHEKFSRSGDVMSWIPSEGHAGADLGICRRPYTRPATADETVQVVKNYETWYECKLRVIKRARWGVAK